MKKFVLTITKIVIIIALSLSSVSLIDENDFWLAYESIADISLIEWLGLFICSVLILFILSQAFLVSMRVVGTHLPVLTSFKFTSMNSFLNNVLPLKGGVVVRGFLLKKRFNVNWGSYLFVVFSGQLFQLMFLFLMFISALYAGILPQLVMPIKIDSNWILGGVIAIVLCSILLIRFQHVAPKLLEKIIKGYKLWLSKPQALLLYFVLIVLFHALSGIRVWCSYWSVGEVLSFGEIVTIYVILAIGMSWSITPGNIGVKEALMVFVSSVIGVDSGVALAASVVDRIASLATITLLGGISTYYLTKIYSDLNITESSS